MSVVGDGIGVMEMLAVRGSGRDVAALPLPAFDRRQPVLRGLGGDLTPDDAATDPIAAVAAAVADADRIATMTAAFRDELVATAYREGAVEFAARLVHLTEAQRREWGARAMLAELACALRMPEQTLARLLARTTALATFPRFREANAAGLVSSWHCDVMLDVFGAVDDEAALAAADEALIGAALAGTASELRVTARRWRARHVPRTAEETRRNLADRRVEVAPAGDDLCWLTALLPAPQAVAIYHKLSDVAAAVQGEDDERTLPQLRADAMCDLLLDPPGAAPDAAPDAVFAGVASGGVSAGATSDECTADETAPLSRVHAWPPRRPMPNGLAGIRPTIVLTVPVLALLGHGDEPADLEGFGPIDIDTARQLAAQAPSFVRVLTHPETGAVLSVGRDRYRVPADLKTALVVRDETCRFPGCRRRATRCDVDHSTAWEHGGRTELCNLAHLCRKHHRLKHELGWTVTHDGGGALTWASPTGRHYRTEPARQVQPPGSAAPPGRIVEAITGPVPRRLAITRAGSADARAGSTEPRADSGYPDEPPF